MNTINDIEQIINLKKIRERKLQVRSIVFVLLIVLFSSVWMWFTSYKIESQRKVNNQLLQEKGKLEGEIKVMRSTLDSISKLSKYSVDVSFRDIKPIYGSNPRVALLLGNLIRLKEKDPRFVYDATATAGYINKNEYSSPSLMIHVLRSERLIDGSVENSKELWEYLTKHDTVVDKDSLKTGDIIFYKTGYVMLYIHNEQSGPNHDLQNEYCIGMTPLGILTLRPNFAEMLQIARPRFNSNPLQP